MQVSTSEANMALSSTDAERSANSETLKTTGGASNATHRARRQRRKRWQVVVYLLLSCGALAVLVMAWLPEPIAVEAVTVRRGPLRVTVREEGRTRLKDRYMLSAPLAGNLARIELRAGDVVGRDAVIARIAPLDSPLLDTRTRAQAEAQLAAAQAAERQAHASATRAELAWRLAERALQRARALVTRGAQTPEVLERAETEERVRKQEQTSADFAVRVAVYQVELSRAALARVRGQDSSEQFELRSPIQGRIFRVLRQSSGAVSVGTQLVEVGDPAALEITVDVLTSDAVRIRPGAKVTIDNWGGVKPLRGHVRMIEPAAFSRISALSVEEQRVNVIVDLDEPHARWAALGDGYRVEAEILITDVQNTLVVPTGAVFRHQNQWAVFAIRNNRAYLQRVTIGEQSDFQTEIKQGLHENEKLVLYPGDRVEDDVRVKISS